jgi:heme/copper-type cytochrome/quinol oxidase subunit 2
VIGLKFVAPVTRVANVRRTLVAPNLNVIRFFLTVQAIRQVLVIVVIIAFLIFSLIFVVIVIFFFRGSPLRGRKEIDVVVRSEQRRDIVVVVVATVLGRALLAIRFRGSRHGRTGSPSGRHNR